MRNCKITIIVDFTTKHPVDVDFYVKPHKFLCHFLFTFIYSFLIYFMDEHEKYEIDVRISRPDITLSLILKNLNKNIISRGIVCGIDLFFVS